MGWTRVEAGAHLASTFMSRNAGVLYVSLNVSTSSLPSAFS